MGYFQVRYDSKVVIYDRRGFIRLATDDSNRAQPLPILKDRNNVKRNIAQAQRSVHFLCRKKCIFFIKEAQRGRGESIRKRSK